ncbi:unnamed protein product [Adineta ricciae]|uniref:Reverse transcriptase domain-containing protein n=1 Tax=Adineta ricciae TaxID=249248 RepID=A0A815EKW2_ADIRI|nr:unnamed protein product [Adineta ricciae]CAF1312884.1 unnamed protein product [Adineta ricciae]
MGHNISLLLLNVASLSRYLAEVFNLFEVTSSPIVILTGTHHKKKATKRLAAHAFNYNFFTSQGSNAFGGVLVAIHKSIRCQRRDEFNQVNNLVVLELGEGTDAFQLASCYSPPAEKIPLEIFDSILDINPNTIFAGDLNAKHSSWSVSIENAKGYALYNWLASSRIHSSLEIINKYATTSTRSDATIDLFIAPSKFATSKFSVLKSIGSDHFPIIWNPHMNFRSNHVKLPIQRTKWKAFDLFITYVGSYWQELADHMNHSAMFFTLYERFLSLCLARFTIVSLCNSVKPSLPNHIVQMIDQKRLYLQLFRRTRHPFFASVLRHISRLVYKEIFQYKRQAWQIYCKSLNDCDTKRFWKKAKNHFKAKSIPIVGLKHNNNVIVDRTEMCAIAKDYYEAQFTSHSREHTIIEAEAEVLDEELEKALIIDPPTPITIDFQELKRSVSTLKNKNSSGLDGVSNRIIKALPSNHLSIILKCFNNFGRTLQTSPHWHTAKMILIPKTKARTIAIEETRPISLLPCFSKLFEKCFLIHFRKWINSQGLLPDEQTGFRPGHNMAVRLVAIVDQIGQSLAKHTAAGGLFVDFRTAFNQLWFQGLWIKLIKLNCPKYLIAWLRHYLRDRNAYIDMIPAKSIVFDLAKGVPQGSVVGPVLFIVYHHDLLESLDTIHWKHLFADDLAILFTPDSSLAPPNMIQDIVEHLEEVLVRLIDYSKTWKQPINFNKTYWMLFNRQVAPKVPVIVCQDHRIDRVNRFKYLGTILDEKLSFNPHIDHIKSKINANLKIFKRLSSTRMTSENTNFRLYNAYIRPYYQSLLNIYPMLSIGKKEQLEGLNRKIFRIIYNWHDARNIEISNMDKYRSLADLALTHWSKLKETIFRTNPGIIQDYLQHKLAIVYLKEYVNNPVLMRQRRTIFGRGRIRKYIRNLTTDNQMTLLDHVLAYHN